MIYEWKCRKCGKIVEVERSLDSWNEPPEDDYLDFSETGLILCEHAWFRYISKAPSVPFQHLRESGEFADEHGNFAPRKLD